MSVSQNFIFGQFVFATPADPTGAVIVKVIQIDTHKKTADNQPAA